MKKLLITDLDDTLYDWIGFFIPSFYAMVDEIVRITGIEKKCIIQEFKEIHQYYGSVEYPFATLKLPSVLKKYDGLTEDEIRVKLGEAFHKFNSVRKQKLCLYEGVEFTLKKLFENGITIIGYTESSQENGYYRLKRLGVAEYFKRIYASRSSFENEYILDEKIMLVDTKKPDKDVLLSICEKENCSIEDSVYVGDSLTKDIYMSGMAGITSVWANYDKEKNNYYELLVEITSWTDEDFKRESKIKEAFLESGMKPDYVINDFKELLTILL